MKRTGIIILSIGLLFTISTIIVLLIQERITDPERKEMAQTKIHHFIWEPMLGAMLVIIGVGIYKVGNKSKIIVP